MGRAWITIKAFHREFGAVIFDLGKLLYFFFDFFLGPIIILFFYFCFLEPFYFYFCLLFRTIF